VFFFLKKIKEPKLSQLCNFKNQASNIFHAISSTPPLFSMFLISGHLLSISRGLKNIIN